MNMIAKIGFLACVLVASFVNANEMELKEVKIEVKLLCPPSDELDNFRKIINNQDHQNYENWVQNFELNMQKLLELVKSGHVGNAGLKIDINNMENSK
jgi:hypothetical protein